MLHPKQKVISSAMSEGGDDPRPGADETVPTRSPEESAVAVVSETATDARRRWLYAYFPWVLWSLIAMAAAILLFVWAGQVPAEVPIIVPTTVAEGGAADRFDAAADADAADSPDRDAVAEASAPKRDLVWRIASLVAEGAVSSEATVGKKTLLATLRGLGASPADSQQLLSSFAEKPSKIGPKAVVNFVKEKGTGRLLAAEIVSGPSEVWQSVRDSSNAWTGKKIDLFVEHRKIARAVAVAGDFRGALVDAGFDDRLGTMIDEALDGHADIAKLRPGCSFKIVATEEIVEGAFARYSELHAVEYQPAGRHKPIRVYHYTSNNKKPVVGYFNAKGEDPYRGKFRAPIPLARVASRFNPRRMHPVLHVVMPHNGIDFAASTGTPIYAPASGTFGSVGDGGACGNMIQIEHPGGLTSIYCHLSRFAPSSRSGAHVEERQLIGYVGQTGRVTGPHLHFGIKRGDRFIDPATLKLDGVRVLPKARKGEFDEMRARLDRELDSIAQGAHGSAEGEEDGGAEEGDAGDVIYETP